MGDTNKKKKPVDLARIVKSEFNSFLKNLAEDHKKDTQEQKERLVAKEDFEFHVKAVGDFSKKVYLKYRKLDLEEKKFSPREIRIQMRKSSERYDRLTLELGWKSLGLPGEPFQDSVYFKFVDSREGVHHYVISNEKPKGSVNNYHGALILHDAGIDNVILPVRSIASTRAGGTFVQKLTPYITLKRYTTVRTNKKSPDPHEHTDIGFNIGKALAKIHSAGFVHNGNVYTSILIDEHKDCYFTDLDHLTKGTAKSESRIKDIRRLLLPDKFRETGEIGEIFDEMKYRIVKGYLDNLTSSDDRTLMAHKINHRITSFNTIRLVPDGSKPRDFGYNVTEKIRELLQEHI